MEAKGSAIWTWTEPADDLFFFPLLDPLEPADHVFFLIRFNSRSKPPVIAP